MINKERLSTIAWMFSLAMVIALILYIGIFVVDVQVNTNPSLPHEHVTIDGMDCVLWKGGSALVQTPRGGLDCDWESYQGHITGE